MFAIGAQRYDRGMNVPAARPGACTARRAHPTDHRLVSTREDAELVRLFKAGDAVAFREIDRRHRARLRAVAFGLLRNHADSDEIAQDTLVRAYRCLALFRGDSSLATWLHRIAVNLARNRYWHYFRRQRHNTDSLEETRLDGGEGALSNHVASDEADPVRSELTREFSQLVETCLVRLDAPSRELLALRNVQNLSYLEISIRLELNIGTVKSRLARSRGRLRALLVASCPDLDGDADLSSWFEPSRLAGGVVAPCA
jgi:RNA polymerase sigma-70 factor (ECF subfamily)